MAFFLFNGSFFFLIFNCSHFLLIRERSTRCLKEKSIISSWSCTDIYELLFRTLWTFEHYELLLRRFCFNLILFLSWGTIFDRYWSISVYDRYHYLSFLGVRYDVFVISLSWGMLRRFVTSWCYDVFFLGVFTVVIVISLSFLGCYCRSLSKYLCLWSLS